MNTTTVKHVLTVTVGAGLIGCAYVRYINGESLEKMYDREEAMRIYRKACAGGHMRGCSDLGGMYREGLGGLEKNEKEAVRLFCKACEGENMEGCYNLGMMYKNGQGGLEKEGKEAVSFFRKACDGGEWRGCAELGAVYEKRRGVAMDDKKAGELYLKACDSGDMMGCTDRLDLAMLGQSLPPPLGAILMVVGDDVNPSKPGAGFQYRITSRPSRKKPVDNLQCLS